MPFTSIIYTVIQTFQYNTIQRTLACSEWLHNIKIKIKIDNTCSFCTNNDSIAHFIIACISNRWEVMTGFIIREENHIHKSILFGFLKDNYEAIVINYCML